MAESSPAYAAERELFYQTNVHLVVNSISLIVFWSTSYNSLLLVRQKLNFSHTVCLLQSTMGLVATLSNVLHSFMLDQDCLLGSYLNVIFYYLSSAAVSWILILKAYALHNKSKLIVLAGGILSLIKIALLAPTLISLGIRSDPLCQLNLPQIYIQITGLVDMTILAFCLYYFAKWCSRKAQDLKLRIGQVVRKDGMGFFTVASLFQFLGLISVLANNLWQGYFAVISMTFYWCIFSKLLYEGLVSRMGFQHFNYSEESTNNQNSLITKHPGSFVVNLHNENKQSIELSNLEEDGSNEMDDSQSQSQVKLTSPME
ncbi:hypothetical protein K7432_001285 [Basidiobolus ranarum]|uniref:Transmembrane protein n=1 Tax=Basidiobolus ranarum TaxID=34480 RepID=A0ABR2W9V3_9FUNG